MAPRKKATARLAAKRKTAARSRSGSRSKTTAKSRLRTAAGTKTKPRTTKRAPPAGARSRTKTKPKSKPKTQSTGRAKKPTKSASRTRRSSGPAARAKATTAARGSTKPTARRTAKPAAHRAANPTGRSSAQTRPQARAEVALEAKPKKTAGIPVPRNLKRTALGSYRPRDDEPFMNRRQLSYFRNKLLDWREVLVRESSQTLVNLQETTGAEPDLADRASAESDRSLELRTRDRERKLIGKIDEALDRIEDGSYGYCEESGEPIGLRRLEARPIATLSIEAQERHERREKVYRDE